jgi:hypothetical protein
MRMSRANAKLVDRPETSGAKASGGLAAEMSRLKPRPPKTENKMLKTKSFPGFGMN